MVRSELAVSGGRGGGVGGSGLDAAAVLRWAAAGGVPALTGTDAGALRAHVSKFSNGQSNPTYRVRVSGAAHADFVVRCRPRGALLPSAHRIDREHRIYAALRDTPVPVPEVYAYCADLAVLGVEFFAMEYVHGRVFNDVSLPRVPPLERAALFREAIRVLVAIGRVDPAAVGLADALAPRPGAPRPWARRQLVRWADQFRRSVKQHDAADTTGTVDPAVAAARADMLDLIAALETRARNVHRLHTHSADASIVQGDYRIDNWVFHPTEPRILAVIDWELCALGDPIADLASFLVPYYMPPSALGLYPLLCPAVFRRPLPEGILLEEEAVAAYAKESGIQMSTLQRDLPFFISLALFRLAAVTFGVAARARAGNASSVEGVRLGTHAPSLFVNAALDALRGTPASATKKYNASVSPVSASPGSSLVERVSRFLHERILPLEADFYRHTSSSARWTVWDPLEGLKREAKEQGMFNLWLPPAVGGKLSATEYAPLAELMGRCIFAAEIFNCSAPDTGNMELLARFGTPEQKKRWLEPLLDGNIRSCFAMTEPSVASSDPTNLSATVRREGSSLVINGTKWWTYVGTLSSVFDL